MYRPGPAILSALAVGAAACGPRGGSESDRAPPRADRAAEVVRTADIAVRGLSPADFPRVQELAEGVYSYEQLHRVGEETITTVSMFVVTPAGVLVADGQESPAETRRLLDAIAEVTDRPVTHVVISSDHGDHTGGNSAFPTDAAFFAHPTSAATLRAASDGSGDRDGGPAGLPAHLVERDTTLDLGGREVRLLHLGRAHTGGDLLVHVPDGKVLFMSETFLNRIFPAMRSAYPSEWVEVIERAQAMDVDVYVPGHGFVESPEVLEEELEAYRVALTRVIGEATRLHAGGVDVGAAVDRADFGDVGEWSLASGQAPRAIARVYMELNGELPE